MKTIYLDLFSGISGDMFLGALLDLGVELPRLEFELAKLKLPGYRLRAARAQKMGISGTKFEAQIHEGQPHVHEEPPANIHVLALPQTAPGPRKGPHGGPVIPTLQGCVELSVFETGVPPRFRLYFHDVLGHAVKAPTPGDIIVETMRPGGVQHTYDFRRNGICLEATTTIPEPHQFIAVLKRKRGRRFVKYQTQFIETHDHHHHGAAAAKPHAHGRNFTEIKKIIADSSLSEWVKAKATAVFQRVAVAEGKIHGKAPDDVHFHEVGAVDSIVDIVGACVALELLGQPRLLASAVVDGTGFIQCAHGRFPIPAPATLEILGARGVKVTQCEEPHELVTPTGAALLAELVDSFGPMRDLVAAKVGYGLGTRDHKTRPNVLRAVLGQSGAAGTLDWETDTIATLQTNLDDINAEILGSFVERALAAGALDVFFTPIQMKKSRPGVLLTVLCADADADKFSELILRETSAFGVRRLASERRKLRREAVTVKTPYGDVAVKLGRLGGQVIQVAPEFDSCKQLADQARVPVKQVYEAALKAART